MFIFKKLFKITGHILFVIIFLFFSTSQAKNYDKFKKSDKIADYFSGIVLLNQNNFEDSYKYLKKLDGLEALHSSFSSRYIYSSVNAGKFERAFNFSKKIERENQSTFESDIIIGLYNLKNSNHDLSKKYFSKAKQRGYRSLLDIYIANTLYLWSDLKDTQLNIAENSLNQIDERFKNLKKIQHTFLNCYYGNEKTEKLFEEIISNQKTDFSRYYFFYAKYLISLGKENKAKKLIELSLKNYPRNLLLNQYKIDLENSKTNINFDCKKETDVVAELLYIAANALSSQSIFSQSNFYLNLSKYLNEDFNVFDTLLAENFYQIGDFLKAKAIYKKMIFYGESFKWYSNKQISRILIKEEHEEKSLKLLSESFNALRNKGIYEIFDFAEFLKNNEKFKQSIIYYSEILNKIDSSHPLYPEVTDARGVAYERIGEWDKAEKDLLASLKVNPNQAYVINYLAYSWIEQGIKIQKSLEMLEKANDLKSNDPFIIDSLGWALFKLKRFQESKDYLQLALKLMPSDPVVNDHYGDVLWKNGKEIQARYYWNYVLNLKKTEKDLKEKVKQKLLKGL
tara:strand:+ start:1557 stop:3257 length:1701 start_codon:yes stop_codon:yes gene_type:complete